MESKGISKKKIEKWKTYTWSNDINGGPCKNARSKI
jgi:hypothetical protein